MTRKPAILSVLMVVLAALAAFLPAGCGREKKGGEVVATVDGQPITQTQVYQALEQSDPGAGQRVLDALVVRQLVREEADKRGIKVDQKELQSRINSLHDYVLASTGKDFPTWLKDTGQSEEDLASRISIQMLMAKLVLTDQDRKEYFEKNKDQIKKDLPDANDSVIFRQIIVGSKTEAEAIRKELEKSARGQEGAPGDFAKVAEERSLDPMTRSRGGMAGWMIKGQSQGPEERDPELEQVLFSLKPGQVGEPMQVKVRPSQAAQATEQQLPERWRMVMVEKRFTARPLTLEGNEDVLEELMLKDPKIQLQAQQFFENLRQKAKIDILAPKYQPLADQYRRAREMRARMQGGAMIPQAAPGMPTPAQPMPEGGAAGGPGGRGGR